MSNDIRREMEATAELLKKFASEESDALGKVASVIADALAKGGTVFFAGNGGSASQAQHAAAEIVGRFAMERPGFRAMALTTDTSVLTSVANDYGYEQVFRRQLEALAGEGDVLVALSTSGNSPNIIKALELARKIKVVTVGLTGAGGGKMADMLDYLIEVPDKTTWRIQEIHLAALHIICAQIERKLAEKGKK